MLLTGHSKGGDYPLVQVYKMRRALLEAKRKWAAMQGFAPNVAMPAHRKEQFAVCLSGKATFHP